MEAYCEPDAPLLHFAEAEILPYERLSVEAGTARERIRALWALGGGEGAAPIVVASVTGLLQKTMSPQALREGAWTVRRGDRVAIEPMLAHWARMGYAVGPMVDHPGTAARRGGIIDVFGAGSERPARIDLWGDKADSIRFFDPNTQRSDEEADAVVVLPATETLPSSADREAVDELVRGLDFTNAAEGERERVQDELADLLAGVSTDNGSLYAGFLLRHTLLDHLPEDAVVVPRRAVRGGGGGAALGGERGAFAARQRGAGQFADGVPRTAGGLGRRAAGAGGGAAPADAEPLPSRGERQAGARAAVRGPPRPTRARSATWRGRRGAASAGRSSSPPAAPNA